MTTMPGLRIMYARLFQNTGNRNWGLRTSTNFASNEGDNLDKSLRELKSLGKFKKTIHNVTFWIIIDS